MAAETEGQDEPDRAASERHPTDLPEHHGAQPPRVGAESHAQRGRSATA